MSSDATVLTGNSRQTAGNQPQGTAPTQTTQGASQKKREASRAGDFAAQEAALAPEQTPGQAPDQKPGQGDTAKLGSVARDVKPAEVSKPLPAEASGNSNSEGLEIEWFGDELDLSGKRKKAEKNPETLKEVRDFEQALEQKYLTKYQTSIESRIRFGASEWLRRVLAEVMKRAVPPEIKQDKGPAVGPDMPKGTNKDDRTLEDIDGFIKKIAPFEDELKSLYPTYSLPAQRELALRREVFLQFKLEHNKSDKDAFGDKAVNKFLIDKTTSCTNLPPKILKAAFENADKSSKEAGGTGVRGKKTSPWVWKANKGKTLPEKARRDHNLFYDAEGRAASEAGAWSPGGLNAKPGDIYVSCKDPARKIQSHIGFFKWAEPTDDPDILIWHTADAGQKVGGILNQKKIDEAKQQGKTTKEIPAPAYDGVACNGKRIFNRIDGTVRAPTEWELKLYRTPGGWDMYRELQGKDPWMKAPPASWKNGGDKSESEPYPLRALLLKADGLGLRDEFQRVAKREGAFTLHAELMKHYGVIDKKPDYRPPGSTGNQDSLRRYIAGTVDLGAIIADENDRDG